MCHLQFVWICCIGVMLARTATSFQTTLDLSIRFQKRTLTLSLSSTLASTGTTAHHNGVPTTRSFFPIYYNDVYEVILPPGHRFPMEKYRKVRDLIQDGVQQRQRRANETDGRTSQPLVDCEFRISPLVSIDDLTLTHSPDYVARFLAGDLTAEEIRNVGFPWSPSGVDRALSSVGGTVAAAVAVCEQIMQHRRQMPNGTESTIDGSSSLSPPQPQLPSLCCWSAHVAGGTHHAFYDRGEGFCVFSDIAVAANVIRQRYPDLVRRILILDLDVHQGNGNAVLFDNRSDVFTFSLHCSANYFSEKQASDLDIELPADCNDETYLLTLRHWLKQIRAHAGQPFDFIFFQAGVDIHKDDRLGRMNLTSGGIRHRNRMVFDFARYEIKAPLVITMGGGYPRTNDWSSILDAHANVYLQAYDYLSNEAPVPR